MFYRNLFRYRYSNFSPAFGMRWLTATARAFPDFMIAGVQKCGTTSLYSYLSQHPQVVASSKKEVKYFDMFPDQSVSWYKAHFPKKRSADSRDTFFVTGEATPDYFFFEECAKQIRLLLPDLKIILLFREPAERAYSQFRYASRRGHETLSFSDALAAESQRVDEARSIVRKLGFPLSQQKNYRELAYKERSLYAKQLSYWTDRFMPQQLLFLSTNNMENHPQKTLRQVTDFLEIDEFEFSFKQRLNTAPTPPPPEAVEHIHKLRAEIVADTKEFERLTGICF